MSSSTLVLLMSVLLAGCGTATRTQSSSSQTTQAPQPQAPVMNQNMTIIMEYPVYTRQPSPRYPYSSEIPQKPMPRSEVIPRDKGEVYHVHGGSITRIERPAWTQKRKD